MISGAIIFPVNITLEVKDYTVNEQQAIIIIHFFGITGRMRSLYEAYSAGAL